MLSPLYTHILLIISAVVFILTLSSFFSRINTDPSQKPQTIVVYIDPDTQDKVPTAPIQNVPLSNNSSEQSNRWFHFQNDLKFNKTNTSILDRFIFVNPTKPICSATNYTENFLIIVVLSRALNFDYRLAIRGTWGRSGFYKNYNVFLKTIFFVGTDDSVQSAIQNEQMFFNDVVEIGIPEHYSFVAHKELASLLWTRLYCPWARIVFRADDDILLDTYLLLDFIKEDLDFDSSDGLYGWFRFNNTVHRADKWAVPKNEYKLTSYPPYTFGIGYLFSNLSCQKLVDAANHPSHTVVRIGDAYITGILRELANIPFYELATLEYAYTFYKELQCDELFMDRPQLIICMSRLHIGLRDDLNEFYDVWDVIEARYNHTLNITGV